MKKQSTRLEKLEKKAPPTKPVFVGWIGNPWTPEQEAEAIRKNPGQKIFWRSLLETKDTPPPETQKDTEKETGAGPR